MGVNDNSSDLPQVILNPVPGFDLFEEQVELYECLEQIDDASCLLRLRERRDGVDWTNFSEESFESFKKACAGDEQLCAALDFWKESRNQGRIAKEKRSSWEASIHQNLKFFETFTTDLGSLQGKEIEVTSSLPRLAGRHATIKLTSQAGVLLTYPYDRASQATFSRDELNVESSELLIRLRKPVVARREFGTHERITLLGVAAELRKAGSNETAKTIHFLASKTPHGILLDPEDLPWGGVHRRLWEFNGDGWKAALRIAEDPLQVFHKKYVESLRETVSDLGISTLTLEGAGASDRLDQLLFSLFLATGHEFTVIESQSVAASGEVLAIKIPTYGHRSFVQAPVIDRREFIETRRLQHIFSRVILLPKHRDVIKSKVRRFSDHHYSSIVHGMLNSWKQPIQKAIVDLYQVIDSLANCHAAIPTSKLPKDEFQKLKNQQGEFVKDALELTSKGPADPTNPSALDEHRLMLERLQNLVQYQSNNPGVAEKIRKLLQETRVAFDENNKTHKAALALRNHISHSLAAAKVQEFDGEENAYPLQELVEIRNTLWGWCVSIVEKMLEL
jgi:hypothetical protein